MKLLFLISMTFLSSCHSVFPNDSTSFSDNDTLSTYYGNGNIESIIIKKNGIENGPSFYYYKNNKIQDIIYYKDGHRIDSSLSYHLNGKLSNILYYDSLGNMKANFRIWYENGNLRQSADINNSDSIETWKLFYYSGNIRQLYFYKNQKRIGTWKFFTEDGKVYKEETYQNDTLINEPALTSIGQNNDTIIETGWKRVFYYHHGESSGRIKTETHYKHSLKNGYSIEYLESGNIKKVSHYKNDLLSGKQFEYYYINNLKQVSDYKQGMKIGEWIYYDKNGDIIKKEAY